MVLILKKKSPASLHRQVNKILERRKTEAVKHAWHKYFGKIKWGADAVTFQRNLRDE